MEITNRKNWTWLVKEFFNRFTPFGNSHSRSSNSNLGERDFPYQAIEDEQISSPSKPKLATNTPWVSLITSSTSTFASSTAAFKPSSIFHLFNSLPPELRIQIWTLALFSTSHTITFHEILNLTSPNQGPPTFSNPEFSHLLLTTHIPISLQICQEMRGLALSRYIFTTGNVRLYLDPGHDTLVFSKIACFTTLHVFCMDSQEADLRRLKRLVVNEYLLPVLAQGVRNDSGEPPFMDRAFKLLSGLTSLHVTLGYSGPYEMEVKTRGQSMLGPLHYDKGCSMCNEMKYWRGEEGWAFPTFEDKGGEEEVYVRLLQMNHQRGGPLSGVLMTYYAGRERDEKAVNVVMKSGKIRACSVKPLHLFLDVQRE